MMILRQLVDFWNTILTENEYNEIVKREQSLDEAREAVLLLQTFLEKLHKGHPEYEEGHALLNRSNMNLSRMYTILTIQKAKFGLIGKQYFKKLPKKKDENDN